MRFLHTMVRVSDLAQSLDFWCNKMGLVETRRKDVPAGKFTLIFLATAEDIDTAHSTNAPELELTYNWDSTEKLETGRSWGHLAYMVDDIYAFCECLQQAGVTINRPPRDGYMAFVKSPEDISVELLQKGTPLPPKEPWASMENNGHW